MKVRILWAGKTKERFAAEGIDKYLGMYDVGWDEIRARRYARQVELGLMPAGLTLPPIAAAPAWDSLSAEDRRMYAKKMAVYKSGYRLFFNVERGGGQVIFHLHLHLIGGW